jgi:hypothetical protein
VQKNLVVKAPKRPEFVLQAYMTEYEVCGQSSPRLGIPNVLITLGHIDQLYIENNSSFTVMCTVKQCNVNAHM